MIDIRKALQREANSGLLAVWPPPPAKLQWKWRWTECQKNSVNNPLLSPHEQDPVKLNPYIW